MNFFIDRSDEMGGEIGGEIGARFFRKIPRLRKIEGFALVFSLIWLAGVNLTGAIFIPLE